MATTHFQLISRGSFRQHVAAFIQRNVAGESMSMKFLISKRKNERERKREKGREGVASKQVGPSSSNRLQ